MENNINKNDSMESNLDDACVTEVIEISDDNDDNNYELTKQQQKQYETNTNTLNNDRKLNSYSSQNNDHENFQNENKKRADHSLSVQSSTQNNVNSHLAFSNLDNSSSSPEEESNHTHARPRFKKVFYPYILFMFGHDFFDDIELARYQKQQNPEQEAIHKETAIQISDNENENDTTEITNVSSHYTPISLAQSQRNMNSYETDSDNSNETTNVDHFHSHDNLQEIQKHQEENSQSSFRTCETNITTDQNSNSNIESMETSSGFIPISDLNAGYNSTPKDHFYQTKSSHDQPQNTFNKESQEKSETQNIPGLNVSHEEKPDSSSSSSSSFLKSRQSEKLINSKKNEELRIIPKFRDDNQNLNQINLQANKTARIETNGHVDIDTRNEIKEITTDSNSISLEQEPTEESTEQNLSDTHVNGVKESDSDRNVYIPGLGPSSSGGIETEEEDLNHNDNVADDNEFDHDRGKSKVISEIQNNNRDDTSNSSDNFSDNDLEMGVDKTKWRYFVPEDERKILKLANGPRQTCFCCGSEDHIVLNCNHESFYRKSRRTRGRLFYDLSYTRLKEREIPSEEERKRYYTLFPDGSYPLRPRNIPVRELNLDDGTELTADVLNHIFDSYKGPYCYLCAECGHFATHCPVYRRHSSKRSPARSQRRSRRSGLSPRSETRRNRGRKRRRSSSSDERPPSKRRRRERSRTPPSRYSRRRDRRRTGSENHHRDRYSNHNKYSDHNNNQTNFSTDDEDDEYDQLVARHQRQKHRKTRERSL
eukprot:gb/GECH01001711.1/.p1 GENE.gb/GECH01001711.1/~~gb/GECH01001711.1/.p1  ORF type:complete len:766 (+),score=193.62 gb/GECH01001711.1/:1-2298(+)